MAWIEIETDDDSSPKIIQLSSVVFSIGVEDGKLECAEDNRYEDILLIRKENGYVLLVNNEQSGQMDLNDGDQFGIAGHKIRYRSDDDYPFPPANRATGIDWSKAIACSLALAALLLLFGFLGNPGPGDAGNGNGLAQSEEGFGNGEGTGMGDGKGPGSGFGDEGAGQGIGQTGDGRGSSEKGAPNEADADSVGQSKETGDKSEEDPPPEEEGAETPPPSSEAPVLKLTTVGNGESANRSSPSSPFEGASGSMGGRGKVLGTGDVQVTLIWEGAPDVDLHVTDPDGEEIWFSARKSESGGELDVDDTDYDGPENIYWPPNGAPRGTYRVDVILFRGNRATWKVRTRVDGVEKMFSGTLNGQGQRKTVTTFTR